MATAVCLASWVRPAPAPAVLAAGRSEGRYPRTPVDGVGGARVPARGGESFPPAVSAPAPDPTPGVQRPPALPRPGPAVHRGASVRNSGLSRLPQRVRRRLPLGSGEDPGTCGTDVRRPPADEVDAVQRASDPPSPRLRAGWVVPQPADGNCLFHSLTFGLGSGDVPTLRRALSSWLELHSSETVADCPLDLWVRWVTGETVSLYARRLAVRGWGGGIELAVFCRLYLRGVDVYEPAGKRHFRRISSFRPPGPPTRVITVLYRGGRHYDALALS